MFSQNEIDAVLQNAQTAVDDLSRDMSAIDAGSSLTTHGSPANAFGSPNRAPSAPMGRAAGVSHRVQRLMRLKVSLRVLLAQRNKSVNDILRMAPGTILEFERSVECPLDLMVNNQKIGQGTAVKVNEHFGLRITSIGDVGSRIHSLGGR